MVGEEKEDEEDVCISLGVSFYEPSLPDPALCVHRSALAVVLTAETETLMDPDLPSVQQLRSRRSTGTRPSLTFQSVYPKH